MRPPFPSFLGLHSGQKKLDKVYLKSTNIIMRWVRKKKISSIA